MRFVLGTVVVVCLLAVSACDQKENGASSKSASDVTENESQDASTGSDEATGSDGSGGVHVQAPDPLSAEALAAQQNLLTSKSASDDLAAREKAMRELLDRRILADYKHAVDDLVAAGVQFDPAEWAVNTLNTDRRSQGVFELDTTYKDEQDIFRIVTDYLTGDPFAVVYLHGTSYPQDFGPTIPTPLLGKDGQIPEGCKVGVPNSASNPNTMDEYSCKAALAGDQDAAITADAKRYLTDALKASAAEQHAQ